jgi:hypothetical protein
VLRRHAVRRLVRVAAAAIRAIEGGESGDDLGHE